MLKKHFASKSYPVICAIAAVSITVFAVLALLYPIILLGFRNTPRLDDFSYGQLLYFSYQNGDGPWAFLRYIWITLKDTFLTWQGTYSAIVLFVVHPGVFGDEWYFITTIVMLLSVLAPLACFYLAFGNRNALRFAGLMACFMFMVSYCPSPAQGFYWWNGAIYYTFFGSLAASVMIFLIKNRHNLSIPKTVLCIIAAIFVSGGNFVVALPFVVSLCFLLAYSLYENRRFSLTLFLILAFAAIGLIISCIAPGNAYRQNLNEQQSIIYSVYWSLRLAARHILHYFDWKFAGFMLVVIPLLVRSKQSVDRRIDIKPFLFFAFCSASIFALMFFPWIYATGAIDYIPERIQNILFYAFVFLGVMNTVWLADILVVTYQPRWLEMAKPTMIVIGIIIFSFNANFSDTTTAKALHGLQQETNDTIEVFIHDEAEWLFKVFFEGETEQVPFQIYRFGAVTFVNIEELSQFLEESYHLEDFSRYYNLYGDMFVPLREACEFYGIGVSYFEQGETVILTLP